MKPLNLSSGEFKQEILKLYNAINKKIFNAGVKQQKVDLVGNKIIIMSLNARVPVLSLMDEHDPRTARQVDQLLFQIFKRDIKLALESQFQFHIVAILKDYDAETEYSGTIIILECDVESYLNDKRELA
ncbi:Na-translocating system protein MpsC family protein [Gorillibacterium massiliense]|uniref:Na-translocating system protein MpsC family protein n=1 Tax=Gorillibacterium massiliense TaxID=1280390 RepID=UPI001EE33CAA|nr:Na-translocating system protein MpsC family protein [Gorillibacterium massiliense]